MRGSYSRRAHTSSKKHDASRNILLTTGLTSASTFLTSAFIRAALGRGFFYNHLLVAGTPAEHIRALIESGKIAKIVDHANYNPRVIEWMTDSLHIGAIAPEEYADAFVIALANPKKLWDTAFRTYIPEKCRHLLYALFFGSQYGEDVADLRLAYQSLHPHLCAKYGQPHDPKDFEESLRILEGGFIAIRNASVSFVNPSFRDYLTDYLNDLELLKDFAYAARQADWARQLWFHGKNIAGGGALGAFARAFGSVAGEFLRIPTWKKSAQQPHYYSPADLANTDRIDLLITWWEATGDEAFARLATDLAARPPSGFELVAGRDGSDRADRQLQERILRRISFRGRDAHRTGRWHHHYSE